MQGATDADPRGKKDPRDFALWKGHKEGEPTTASWVSPWGAGRPGWHLECSAMVTKYLGTEFDIHGGGLDLRFPHHENEMAQSQAAGHAFANFWMHNGMVTYQGEKMSKSVGNTVSPAEMLELAPPRVVRYYLGQAQYRSVLDYQPTSLQEAAAAVERIDGFIARAVRALSADGSLLLRQPRHSARMPSPPPWTTTSTCRRPSASLHDTVRAGNTALTAGDFAAARQALTSVTDMLRVLGISDAAQTAVDDQATTALGDSRGGAARGPRRCPRHGRTGRHRTPSGTPCPPPASWLKTARTAPPGAFSAANSVWQRPAPVNDLT